MNLSVKYTNFCHMIVNRKKNIIDSFLMLEYLYEMSFN